jgi:hypothetical protein
MATQRDSVHSVDSGLGTAVGASDSAPSLRYLQL